MIPISSVLLRPNVTALSVVLFMIQTQGIAPNRLAANGFGEYQPVNDADSPQARAQNRRIEIKLTER